MFFKWTVTLSPAAEALISCDRNPETGSFWCWGDLERNLFYLWKGKQAVGRAEWSRFEYRCEPHWAGSRQSTHTHTHTDTRIHTHRETVFRVSTLTTHVMIRVSSPGSPSTPSTNRGELVKLYLFHWRPSSKLNLGTQKQPSREAITLSDWARELMTLRVVWQIYFIFCSEPRRSARRTPISRLIIASNTRIWNWMTIVKAFTSRRLGFQSGITFRRQTHLPLFD